MLRIAVCVKQVPARSEGMMDPQTGTIRREGLESVMNPFDAPAIETALRVKEASAAELAAEVHVFSMGSMKAAAVVREAFGVGADRGYLLSDSRFSGADVFATAYTLVQGIRQVGDYDLIICGRQTTDGGTSQVGGTIAQMLAIPHVAWASKLVDVDERGITVVQELERELLTLQASFPCVISVEPAIFTPRLPALRLKLAASKRPLTILTLDDFSDTDQTHYGLRGSPTKVEKIYPVPSTQRRDLLDLDAETAAELILDHVWLLHDDAPSGMTHSASWPV